MKFCKPTCDVIKEQPLLTEGAVVQFPGWAACSLSVLEQGTQPLVTHCVYNL